MEDCIFCLIIKDNDPGKLIWQNDVAVAFHTIAPKAPVHVLVAPRQHIENLDTLDDPELAGKLLMAVREVAGVAGVRGAWRLGVNNGSRVGQSVMHLHFHIVGGTEMAE